MDYRLMEWFNGLGTSMIYKRCFYLISEKIFVFDVLRIRFIPYSILTIRIYNRDNPYSYMNPIAIRVRIRIRTEIWKQIWYQRYPFVSDPFSSLLCTQKIQIRAPESLWSIYFIENSGSISIILVSVLSSPSSLCSAWGIHSFVFVSVFARLCKSLLVY